MGGTFRRSCDRPMTTTPQVTGVWVDSVVRGRAETRDAFVVAGIGADGRYTLSDPVTGGTYKADTMLTVSIGVGKRVLVQHNASGRSKGRTPLIIGVSQDSANGAIVGELAISAPVAAETVTELPELPVILLAGGLNQIVTIYGVGLSSAILYGAPGIT